MFSRKFTAFVCALATAFTVGCAHTRHQKSETRDYQVPGHWANVGRECDSTAAATELPATVRDTLANPFDVRGGNGPWTQRAAIARGIPGGWGGLTGRKEGLGFAIYLTDTTQRAAALDALAKAGVPDVSSNTEARPARWTYGQLYDWFGYVHMHLRRVRVTMWSLDESRNRIYYGVETEEAGLELDRQLTALNVPCFLVWREVIGAIQITSPSVPNKR